MEVALAEQKKKKTHEHFLDKTADFQLKPGLIKISTLHEAMTEAALESKRRDEGTTMIKVSTLLSPNDKEQLERLCENHGTNMSEFLRQCVLKFLEDYRSDAKKT